MTLQTFKDEILTALENKPLQWRKGQFVFNYIDGKYAVAREVQFVKGVDCFYNDSLIDSFIEASYKTLEDKGAFDVIETIENSRSIPEEYKFGFFRGWNTAKQWNLFDKRFTQHLKDQQYLVHKYKNGPIDLLWWNSHYKCWDDYTGDDFECEEVYDYRSI